MSITQPYSQAPLTFLDEDIGLEYGADTQVGVCVCACCL